MATSGVIYQNFAGYFRLQLEWSSTQNVSAGTSSITANLYLMSLSSYSTIRSSSSKTFTIQIGGLSNSTTGNLNLNGNQKKLLHSWSRTLTHESDGTLEVQFRGRMDWGLNINGFSGSYVEVNRTDSLPTISTASTIGTISEWRAGNTMSVTINRKSTGYTHTVRAYVRGTLVATRTSVGTSVRFDFTDAEYTKIFNAVGTSTSAPAEIQVDTFSGSSKIGSTTSKSAVVMAAMRSTFDPNMDKDIEVGDAFTVRPVRYNYLLNHKIEMIRNGVVKGVKVMPAGEAETVFSTGAIVEFLYNEIGTKQYIAVVLRLTTYYGDQQVREPAEITMNIYPKNEDIAPTFTGSFTVTETDTKVGTLLGTGYFLSGISDVRVSIPAGSLATANAGASIASYTITIGNRSETVYRNAGDTTAVTVTLNNINALGTTTVTITATDTRGLTATQSMTVEFIPYLDPRINAKAERVGRFEDETTVTFGGSISAMMKGSTPLNSVKRKVFRYKPQNSSTWTTRTLTPSTSTDTVTLTLNNTLAYNFEFELEDQVTTTVFKTLVPAGRPTWFVDSERNSVGINKFPENNGSFESPLSFLDEIRMPNMTMGPSGSDLYATGTTLYAGQNKSQVNMMNSQFRAQATSVDLSLYTTKPKFWFNSPVQASEFQGNVKNTSSLDMTAGSQTMTLGTDGRLSLPNYTGPNGGNMVFGDAGSHNDPLMIQVKTGAFTIPSGSAHMTHTGVTFDKPFRTTPEFVLVQSTNHGGQYFFSVYERFAASCNIAVRRIDGRTDSAYVGYVLVAMGRV